MTKIVASNSLLRQGEMAVAKRDSYLYYKSKSLNNGSSYSEYKEKRSGNGSNVKIVLDEQENVSHQFGQHAHAPNPEVVICFKTSF